MQTSTPHPSLSPTLTATITWITTDIPEPTWVVRTVQKPDQPLDRKDVRSILNWIKYSFSQQETTIFDTLARTEVHFGISEAEYTERLDRDSLIRDFQDHIGPQTQCLAYTYRQGEINYLTVFIADWAEAWELGQRNSNDLILNFSDQYTLDAGLQLIAIAVPRPTDQYYEDQIYEHSCLE